MKTTDFEFVRQLDSGSFGSIHLVRRKFDDKKFVIKRQGKYYNYAQNEEMIMKKLRHPNVLGYYGSWEEADESKDNEQNENEVCGENEECEENEVDGENEEEEKNLDNEETIETKENEIGDEQDEIDDVQENEVYEESEENEGGEENDDNDGSSSNKYYILMEYISGGTLFDLLNEALYDGRTAMKENEALYFFSQLALGLDHLHSQGIIHRDIKPENIMFAGPLKRVKIIDFGLSRDVSEEADVQMVNPNDYTAPENFSDDVPYTFKSDIWSIATLLYEVVTGCRPEHLENRLDVLEELPPSVGTVCKSIMKVEPSERPESHEVIKYPELKMWMRKYYRGLDEEGREVVQLQLYDVIDCDDN